MITTRPLECHYPFYKVDEIRGRPAVIGSGILLKFREYRFLLSAAHVFDEIGNSLSFPEAGVEETVPVEVYRSNPPPSGRKDDLLDVAFTRLPNEIGVLLERRFQFISIADIDTTDAYHISKKYCFSGFPGTRANVRFPARRIDVDCYEYRLDPYEITAECPPWHPALHIAGHFERDKMRIPDGERITAPEPNGISGGGVWTYSDTAGYKLVGIGINWDEKYNILVGARIGAWTSYIRQIHPELLPYLPIDPRVNIQFEEPER